MPNGWGDRSQKCDVPLITECAVVSESKIRTEVYEPSNATWNSITWSPKTDYNNHKGVMIGSGLESYVEQGYRRIGVAGTGKSEILQEAECILSNTKQLDSLSQHVQHRKHVKLLTVLLDIDCLVVTRVITHTNIKRSQS
jgi:hypothetical protein